MSQYTPDRWVVIYIVPRADYPNAVAHYRVFASWYGGYCQGEAWRMNSGIVRAEEDERFYYFYGNTGSMYTCPKSGYGFTSYGASVLSQMKERATGLDIYVQDGETDFCTLEYK